MAINLQNIDYIEKWWLILHNEKLQFILQNIDYIE